MATLAALLRSFRAFGQRQPAMTRCVRLPPLYTAQSLQEKMQALAAKDPVYEERVDIGFKISSHSASRQELKKQRRIIQDNKNNYDMAEKSRNGTLRIQYEDARQEWKQTHAPVHVKDVADHYGVFKDLYEFGFFHPVVPMDILYDYNADYLTPVHYGNIIRPSERQHQRKPGGKRRSGVRLPAAIRAPWRWLPPIRVCPVQAGWAGRLLKLETAFSKQHKPEGKDVQNV